MRSVDVREEALRLSGAGRTGLQVSAATGVSEATVGRCRRAVLGGRRALFCEACDALAIRWTLSDPRNVSVAHRESVARLDELVGPTCQR